MYLLLTPKEFFASWDEREEGFCAGHNQRDSQDSQRSHSKINGRKQSMQHKHWRGHENHCIHFSLLSGSCRWLYATSTTVSDPHRPGVCEARVTLHVRRCTEAAVLSRPPQALIIQKQNFYVWQLQLPKYLSNNLFKFLVMSNSITLLGIIIGNEKNLFPLMYLSGKKWILLEI